MAKNTPRARSCLLSTCDSPAQIGELCKACYNRMYYWKDATPTKRVKHYKRAARCAESAEFMVSNMPRPESLNRGKS